METHAKAIAELRERFFRKLDDEGPPDSRGFHSADIARIKNSDDWLKRFLEHHEYNEQEAFNMLWETCTWRRKFGTNDITEDNVRRDYLEDGSIFGYSKDKDGKKLFIIKSKLHVKGVKDFPELQRCIVYWFERLEREGNGNQISIFFDMAEAGLSNTDMELTKYLIGLFKSYYPNFLNYIIIFEMPWVLNAAFKIIKSWLPAKAVPKIKFVNKTTLKDYVNPNDAMKCWGGNSDYTFKFVSEIQTNGDSALNGKLDNKKVHFIENSPLTEQSPTSFGDQINEEQLLSIEPTETITFNKDGNDITGIITLKNITTDKNLSYKIKTTSPEKFRVRPSSGILQPSEQRNVTVLLQPGYNVRGLLQNDRFLVMCLPLKDTNATSQELAVLWKSEKATEMHKLRCHDGTIENNEIQKSHSVLTSAAGNDRNIDAFFSKINHLEKHYSDLRSEMIIIKYILLFSIILTIAMAILVVYILQADIKDLVDQQTCQIPRGI
ncbi:motile sperm domain-containing protein 2-like isoform X1 [Pogonomyrmex barbatus]|uniref:Motile sperm domain-containing protein 2-like isoform X1 n=2 Tax=Pogonomyrmex barbatus TaxID=144034 RepID=A0A6I9W0E3_9HYME|nr:motile sperm domain-containing protein 2-like isoform X1 [Pogonomyrmex barbatus]XP_025073238.1 motile sperm domain-containing protein 2-like isoform X1 [Pogonomyrmex barbatus]